MPLTLHSKHDQLVEVLKALSDPTRLRLVRLLGSRSARKCAPDACGGGPLCVNALAHNLGITQSAVSQHLRILKHARLVRGLRRGTFMHYSLDQDSLNEALLALCEALNVRLPTK